MFVMQSGGLSERYVYFLDIGAESSVNGSITSASGRVLILTKKEAEQLMKDAKYVSQHRFDRFEGAKPSEMENVDEMAQRIYAVRELGWARASKELAYPKFDINESNAGSFKNIFNLRDNNFGVVQITREEFKLLDAGGCLIGNDETGRNSSVEPLKKGEEMVIVNVTASMCSGFGRKAGIFASGFVIKKEDEPKYWNNKTGWNLTKMEKEKLRYARDVGISDYAKAGDVFDGKKIVEMTPKKIDAARIQKRTQPQ